MNDFLTTLRSIRGVDGNMWGVIIFQSPKLADWDLARLLRRLNNYTMHHVTRNIYYIGILFAKRYDRGPCTHFWGPKSSVKVPKQSNICSILGCSDISGQILTSFGGGEPFGDLETSSPVLKDKHCLKKNKDIYNTQISSCDLSQRTFYNFWSIYVWCCWSILSMFVLTTGMSG